MKEHVVIVTCKVPSEAYQILSAVRQKPKRKWIKVSYGALVKKDAHARINIQKRQPDLLGLAGAF